MKNITRLFVWLIPAYIFISSALPARAVYTQSGETVVVSEGKNINEAALITGSSISVDADINGDLYCAGRDVVINGAVKGDIACLAQSIKVNGSVDGNIRVLAQTIDIAGTVARNLTVASQKLVLGPKSQVKGDIFFGAQNVDLNGQMGRDLAGASETITISGSLLRNATVTGTTLSVIETGKIGGNLDYYMEKTATASVDKKNVKGAITRHEIETTIKPETEKKMVKNVQTASFFKTVYNIIAFALLGLLLIYFDRKNVEKRISIINQKPFIIGLIGLATLITAPIVFLLLLITVIGIPFALVSLFVFIVALITASLYPSAIIGKLFAVKIIRKKPLSLPSQMVLGVTLLGLISYLPVIGWIVAFAAFCVGLGAFLVSFFPEKK